MHAETLSEISSTPENNISLKPVTRPDKMTIGRISLLLNRGSLLVNNKLIIEVNKLPMNLKTNKYISAENKMTN